jgi:transposase
VEFLPEIGMMPIAGETMTRRPRRNHSPAFKAKVALAAVRGEKSTPATPTVDVKTLHAKIGELTLENDFLSGALGKAGLLPSGAR